MKKILETDNYTDWIDGLRDKRAQLKIDVRVKRLAQGNPGDCKNLADGVSEMRIDYGPGYRVYYMQAGEIIIVLLAGGDKGTQRKDIAKAKELAAQLRKDGIEL